VEWVEGGEADGKDTGDRSGRPWLWQAGAGDQRRHHLGAGRAGICGRRSAAAAIQAQYGIPFATTDYEQLLARDDIAIIAILTPDASHHDQIIAALVAGKHVVVTKPMVTSLAEATAVVAAVERSGRKLLVGQTSRWQPQNIAIKSFLDDGSLGDILIIEAAYVQDLRPVYDWSAWRYTQPRDYLYGGAIHSIDLLCWFVGEVAEVTCLAAPSRTDDRYPADMPDNFLISLRFGHGGVKERWNGGACSPRAITISHRRSSMGASMARPFSALARAGSPRLPLWVSSWNAQGTIAGRTSGSGAAGTSALRRSLLTTSGARARA